MVISELLSSVIAFGANDFEAEAEPSVTLSVDELVWLPIVMLAVLLIMVPTMPDRVPVTVKMRLLLLGRLAEGITMPEPCMSSLKVVKGVGQVDPLAVAQVTELTVRPLTAGSVRVESCNLPPESLNTAMVLVIGAPGLIE